MDAAAHYLALWHASTARYAGAEPEVDADQIEAAMRTLAFEVAKRGQRSPLSVIDALEDPPSSAMQMVVADPIRAAFGHMEMALGSFLSQVFGPERATEARDRINAALFEAFDRSRIDAAGPKQ